LRSGGVKGAATIPESEARGVKKKKKKPVEQTTFWPVGEIPRRNQKSLKLIKLPNGWLDEYDKLPDQFAGGVRTLLEGQLVCLMCQNRYAARVMIHNILAKPVLGISSIACPDCNAPILNLGTDNGRAMLVRLKK
jgi:hypothetical protein